MEKEDPKWKMIAGKGELGNMMWGDYTDFSEEELKRQYKALEEHKHEKVLLSGGGSYKVHVARLSDVWIEKRQNGDGEWYKRLRVELTDVTPRIANDYKFTPYIGSYQISIWMGEGEFPYMTKREKKRKERSK